MAKHTTTTITNELDFVGRIWQPGTGLCVGRARPTDADVRAMINAAGGFSVAGSPLPATPPDPAAMRAAIMAYLKATEGDFSEIVDFYADFGDPDTKGQPGSVYYVAEWADSRHETAFEAADGYSREPGEVGEADCDWCGVPHSVIANAFGEPLCEDCAAECCATCSRGLTNDASEHEGCSGEPLRAKVAA